MANPEVLQRTVEQVKKHAGDVPQKPSDDVHDVRGRMQGLETRTETQETEGMTFGHVMQYEQMRYQKRLLYLSSKQKEHPGSVDPMDLQASALMLTYFEYLPRVTNQYLAFWDKYLAIIKDPGLPPLPADLRAREAALQSQLIDIDKTMRSRNIMQEGYILRRRINRLQKDNAPESNAQIKALQAKVDAITAVNDVPEEIRNMLREPHYEDFVTIFQQQQESLHRQLLFSIRGDSEGKDVKGDSPLELYADALKAVYAVLADRERDVARSSMKYAQKITVLRAVAEKRAAVADEMVRAISDQGTFNVDMAELTATQNMFGRPDAMFLTQYEDLPPAPKTIGETKERMVAFADDRTNRRLTAIETQTKRIEVEVLTIGPAKQFEDIWNKKGREAVAWVLDKVAGFVTLPLLSLPGGVRASRREEIIGPLYDAMGYPPGVRDFEALTPGQKQKVLENATSIKDCILAFDRSSITRLQETTKLLRMIQSEHPASQYFGENFTNEEQMRQNYPVITEANFRNVIRESNVATVYKLLYEQLHRQFGTYEPASGYMKELRKLQAEIQRVIGVHAEVASGFFHVSHQLSPIPEFDNLLWYLSAGTGASIGARKEIAAAAKFGLKASLGMNPFGGSGLPKKAAGEAIGSLALSALGASYYAYELYKDWGEAKDFHEFKETVKGVVDVELKALQQELGELVKRGSFRMVDEQTYVHVESGLQVNIPTVNTITASLDWEMAQQYAKAGKDAGLAMYLLMRTLRLKGVTGPAGLAITAVEVTYNEGADAWKKANVLAFMRDAPPWLVAKFGTMQLTKFSEYDILTHASAPRLSSIFHSLDATQKEDARRKLYFSIFSQELQELGGDLWEIEADRKTIPDMQVLFDGDFKSIILPCMLVNLRRETGVSWDMIAQGKIDSGLNVIPPNVTLVHVRKAMREATAMYLMHQREKTYVDLLKNADDLKMQVELMRSSGGDASLMRQKERELATMRFSLDVLKGMNVLGKDIGSMVTAETARANGWRTRAELVTAELAKDGGVRPNFSAIRGLPDMHATFDGEQMIGFIEDPVLREKLRSVFPRSTDEREARLYPAWNEWPEQIQNLLPSMDRDRMAKSTLYAVQAANNILRDVRKRVPEAEAARWAAIPEEAGLDSARSRMTKGIARYADAVREKSWRIGRDALLESELYHDGDRPIVFSRFLGRAETGGGDEMRQRTLCALVSHPNVQEEAFRIGKAKAALFEGYTNDAGFPMVLATFFYGDIEGGNNIVALQVASSSAASGREAVAMSGHAILLREKDILKMPQGTQMLTEVRKGLRERREQDELDRFASDRKEEQDDRDRKRRAAEIMSTLSSDRYVTMPDGTFIKRQWMSDGSDVIVTFQKPGLALSERREKERYDGESITFQTREKNGGMRTYRVEAGFERVDGITARDKEIMRMAVTTPVEGDDAYSLRRVLDLYPHTVYRSRFFRNHFWKEELFEELVPLYKQVPMRRKSSFLEALLQKLEEAREINKECRMSIVLWFRERIQNFNVSE